MPRLLPAFFLMAIFFACPAHAGQDVKTLGSFGKWAAYVFREGGKPVCYMTLRPQKAEWKNSPAPSPKNKKEKIAKREKVAAKTPTPKRGDMLLMVTLRPAESYDPVVSYRAGYQFKQSTEASVRFGPKPYSLFTEKDQAWARSAAIDIAITKALRKAKDMHVEGVASSGAKSLDTFDLSGAESAYKAIAKACGINS